MIFFFAFLLLTKSIFVPYHNTETPILLQFTDKELSYTKNLYRPFIVLVISYARSYNNEAVEIMSQMSLEFGEKVLFGLILDSQSKQIYEDIQKSLNNQSQPLRPPFIAYYDVGRLIYCTNFIYDEVAISSTINFWLKGPKSVSNSEELFQSLGNTPISIISKKSMLKEAFNITSKALKFSGPIELIQAEDELFNTINLTDYNFAVFVDDDKSINGFSNLEDFFKYSQPHFKVLNLNDATSNLYDEPENTVVSIFDTDLKIEYNNTLYELKEKYPQYLYGLAHTNSLFELYSDYTHQKIENFPEFLIFNREEKFYYPLPENLKKSQNSISFILGEYVKSVNDGKIQKVYMSEEINESISNENEVTKLVGKTFENFVNDTEKDSLIFFGVPDDYPYYYKYFMNAKKNISSLGINLKFGYIEPNRNSSPYRFPKIYSNPHIELYLKDGTMIPMLNIINEEGILRFLHFFLPEGNFILSTNFTNAQVRTEKYRISSIYKNNYDDYMDLFNSMFENIDNPAHIIF